MIHDTVEIVLRNKDSEYHSVWFNVFNTPLARKWYDAYSKWLKETGWTANLREPGLFSKKSKTKTLMNSMNIF